jgi:undecaprenyl-phosphate 4-deoxy-4-formamido-L-arabinose transferase
MQIEKAGPTDLLPWSVSVVVAVHNSEATLVELSTRIMDALVPLVPQLEILYVNDGSSDRSWQVVTELAERHSEIRGLNLTRNYGQHNALLAGILRAQGKVTVTLDDDLQHPPEEIPRLLSKLNEGYDVVYGRPAERQHSIGRNLSSKALKAILKTMVGAEMAAHSSAFRAFRSVLRQGFEDFRGSHLSIDVLLSWSSGPVTHVPVEHHARAEGSSGYTLSKLLLLAFNMLTGYSTRPLRFASAVGLLTSLFGLLMFVYLVMRRLFQTAAVPGFAFLASEIALFAGMQMFAIGVIGEYLAQLHFRSMGKPPYVIREEVGSDVLPE